MWTVNFQMFKLDLAKAEQPEIKLLTSVGSSKKQESSRKKHVFLNPGLENFEHYFTSVWDECNCVVVWAFFDIAFFGIGMKADLFQSCGHCWIFQICWHIECSTFTASSCEFRRNNYLRWSLRTVYRWEPRFVPCVGLVFLVQGLF